jgi:hypothetical protein
MIMGYEKTMLQELFNNITRYEDSKGILLLQDLEEMKYFKIVSGYDNIVFVLTRKGNDIYPLCDCIQYCLQTKDIRQIKVDKSISIIKTNPVFKNELF